MGFPSQSGLLGFGFQGGGKGVAAAATRFVRVKGGAFGPDRALLIPDPEIGGHRDIAQAYLGPVGFSADYDFYPRMEMVAFLLKAVLGSAASSNIAGTNEVQTITITGTPTGGTFTLSYRGQTTAAIAYNANAAAVDSALEALSSIGTGNITTAGGPGPGTPWTVTFNAALAATNPPMMTADISLLTGGTPALAVTASTPGAYPIGTHIITPSDTLPWVTAEERISTSFESLQYVDAKVNSLRLECDAAGYLMGNCSIMALSGTSGFTAQTAPAFDTTPMSVGSKITVSFAGVNLPGKSFNLEITNDIEGEDYGLGSIYGVDLTEKRRTIKMGVTRRPDSSSLWKAAMWGTTGLTQPQAGPAYQGAVVITISSYEYIAGTTPFSLTINAPAAVIAPYKPTPNGDDVLQEDFEITFLRPDPLVPIATFTVKNDLTTVV